MATPEPAPTFQVLAGTGGKVEPSVIGLYDSASGEWRQVPTTGSVADARFAGSGRLAYLTPGGIVSENFDGSDRRTEVAGAIVDQAWLPDGAAAYVTALDAGAYRYRLTIRVPGQQPVSVPSGGNTAGRGGIFPESRLQFSPDGSLLLGVSVTGTPDEQSIGSPSVHVWRLDGSVVFSASSEGGAAWGADGRVYLFSGTGLQVVDLTTHVTRTVLSGVHGWNPAISPDGRYIAYERRDPAPPDQYYGGYGPSWLELADLDTGGVVGGFHVPGGSLPRFVTTTQVWFGGSNTGDPIVSYDVHDQVQGSTGTTGVVMDVLYQGAR